VPRRKRREYVSGPFGEVRLASEPIHMSRLQFDFGRDPLLEFADFIFGVLNAFGNAHAIRHDIPHELFLQ